MINAKSLVLAVLLYGALGSTDLRAADWTPDPSLPNPQLHQRLYQIGRRYCDANFDPAVNMVHQKPRDHIVRESAAYAAGLLMTGDPADNARAQAILRNVIATQDTRPNSDWRGAFPWRSEDKWENLKSVDLNSATFIGSTLAGIIEMDRKRPMLDPDLREKIERAGKLAVEEILRRDVDPGYTNIALLSTSFAAAGETLWKVPGARQYAERKLDAVLKLADDGAVYEYLSPTYSAVDFGGAYGARHYAFSDDFAAKADAMIDHLWKEIALSYHAPTYQLAGPHNRSYGDNMLTYSAGLKYWLYLALDGNYPIPDSEVDHPWDQAGLMVMAGMPIGPRPEFKLPIPPWREITAVGPDDGHHPTRHLFQYREGNMVLGTVAMQDEWKQKRNLVAYWRSDAPAPAPANFQVGYCIDESNETLPNGFPYAQIMFYSKQVKGSALVILETPHAIPDKASCCLVFNKEARVTSETDASPIKIEDGSITAYIYPVSSGAAHYKSDPGDRTLRLTRDWTEADDVGELHVMSYLLVLRTADQPPPKVTGLSLAADQDGVAANATVDGGEMAVSSRQ